MKKENWVYENLSVEQAVQNSERTSGTIKGCIARLISNKKTDILHLLQKTTTTHGLKVIFFLC
jgi:hypothetical protein